MFVSCIDFYFFFFFKQKTAYEMRISDWSSDVCSSDLTAMSKASAHRVLLTLADADFLARHAKRKTYSLGMGLLAVGQASLEKYRGLDVARAEMARLTAELSQIRRAHV